MVSNSSDLKITLEKHGSKVVNALGVIVLALQTEDDAKLLAKVKEVLFITEMLLIFTHRYEYKRWVQVIANRHAISLIFQIVRNHWKRAITDTSPYQVLSNINYMYI